MNNDEHGLASGAWVARRGLLLAAVLAACAAIAAPADAGSTTTITSASCSLADSTVTFSWSGKTPFAYRVEWGSFVGKLSPRTMSTSRTNPTP